MRVHTEVIMVDDYPTGSAGHPTEKIATKHLKKEGWQTIPFFEIRKMNDLFVVLENINHVCGADNKINNLLNTAKKIEDKCKQIRGQKFSCSDLTQQLRGYYRRGLPDLFIWRPPGEYRWVEVKSKGDNIQQSQLEWANKFNFDFHVLFVFPKVTLEQEHIDTLLKEVDDSFNERKQDYIDNPPQKPQHYIPTDEEMRAVALEKPLI